MESRPLDYVSKRDAIAEVLRREIFEARLKPGAPLRQEQIAARLGVSPTPVREAFRILEAEGYVESRPHRGVVVADRNYDDLLDVYEIRLALECLAVRRIAGRVDDHMLSDMVGLLADAERAMKRGHTMAFRKANARFHEALVLAPGSQVVRNIMSRLAASWFFFPQDQHQMEVQHQDHLDVISAIRRGDQATAVDILNRHVARNIEVLMSFRDVIATEESAARPDRRSM